MRNRWLFTPLPNGEIEAQIHEDLDTGIPYLIYNRKGAEDIYETLDDLARLFNQDKYAATKWYFVSDLVPGQ